MYETSAPTVSLFILILTLALHCSVEFDPYSHISIVLDSRVMIESPICLFLVLFKKKREK